MRLIAHRSNYTGKNIENSPNKILETLTLGFDVEVDVWLKNNKFYTGHDKPEYIVTEEFLSLPNLWLHCKNIEALLHFKEKKVNCFWHDTDDYAILLSNALWQKNLIWTCKYENNYNIIVMDTTGNFLESLNGEAPKIWGYCADDLTKMKAYLEDIKHNIITITATGTAISGDWTYSHAGNGKI